MKMKMGKKYKFTLMLVLSLIFTFNVQVFAQVPYKTLTQGPNSEIVDTQTAYEPAQVYKIPTTTPEDIHLADDGTLYIADTGNGRIVVTKNGEFVKFIGQGTLQGPSGVYASEEKIYVADALAEKVFVFDLEGNVVQEIGKPDSPLYGKKSAFIPKKVTVDQRGNIYVVSEGSTNGLVQLNNKGEFTGYFASNMTNTSFKMILQRTLYGESGKAKLMKNVPPSPTNLAIDSNGLIYTATKGSGVNSIKKFNVSGKNILDGKIGFAGASTIDIEVDQYGNIFTIDEDGIVFEYDSFGNLLFIFGGKDRGDERIGLTKSPAAIEIGNDGALYLLDKEKSIVQVYEPTAFANEVHKGIVLYKEGLYVESEEIWNNVLKMNSSFILSYQAIAKSYFKRGLNEEALDTFKLAEDKGGYSEAFWEIRNQWLQENLGIVFIILFVLYVLWKVLKRVDRKRGIFDAPRTVLDSIKHNKIVSEVAYMKRFLINPLDAYYEIKRRNRVSVWASTILYVWFAVLQITDIYLKGYIFTGVNPSQVNVLKVVGIALVPIVLWIIANHLVSTISNGEGRLKDIYNGTIYALSPYLIFALPLQLLTNVLSLNEGFIYTFSMIFVIAWCVILLFLMIKEIHNYSFGETVKNILLTLFGMILIVLTLFIIFILVSQEVDFVKSIIQELKIRV